MNNPHSIRTFTCCITIFCGAAVASLAQAASGDPSAKATGEAFPAGVQQSAFGVESIKLGGVMGHRIETMIKGNLLKIDMEDSHLSYYRKRPGNKAYRGLGLTLDAVVRLCAYSQDPELVRLKDQWIGELISTQDPDGYIGLYPKVQQYGPDSMYSIQESCQIILALTADGQISGSKRSLEAARKVADNLLANWTKDSPINPEISGAQALIQFSETTGDPKYLNWVKENFSPGGDLNKSWVMKLGGEPLKPLNMEGRHLYTWCDVNIGMLSLNRHFPDKWLTAGWPQMIDWFKDGGALPQGSFAWEERYRRSQTTRTGMDEHDPEFLWQQPKDIRTKCGESCPKSYVVQLLNRLMEEEPDSYFGDVMERAYYNGIFASQTPDGRHLAYDLSVEGTRVVNPSDHYCCPGNLRRAFAYLPGYIYRKLKDGLYVNLYAESDATIALDGGVKMKIKQVTDYPMSGNIRVQIYPASPVKTPLVFRIPAWCEAPVVKLNGEAVADVKPGTFLRLDREWKGGDTVALDFPMKWRWERGIREQEGRACLLRGPVAYTLNPFRSGLDWYQDMQIDGFGVSRVVQKKIPIPNLAEHMKAFARLEEITLDPNTLSAPQPDANVHPFGQSVTVKGWLGEPKGAPDQTFTFTEFVDPQGRKVFLKLSARSSEVDDELFGKEIHEKTVYPARWAAVKKGLDSKALAAVPNTGLEQTVLIKPMRGSYEAETALGELAGRPAWMSASLAKTGKRRMEFRVHDPKFEEGATPDATLSVLYLDRGNCKVSLIYDSGDEVVRQRGRAPGAYKPGGEFQIGNSGTIKRHDFKLPDARFAQNLRNDGTDFRLVANKDVDFVILGAFLQPATK